MRRSALALVADFLLADGKIDGRGRRFLQRLAVNLEIPTKMATDVVGAMLVKNYL